MGSNVLPASRHHARRSNYRCGNCTAAGARLWPMMLGLAIVMAAGVPMPVGAAPDVAVRDGLIRTFAKPSGAGQVLRQMSPPALAPVLARFTPNRFLEHRQELMGALYVLRDGLISAIRPTPKEMDLLIDLAALHLSQRMLPEARSFLDALPEAVGPSGGGGARMTAAQEGRARSIGAALDGFSDVEASCPGRMAGCAAVRGAAAYYAQRVHRGTTAARKSCGDP